MKDDVPHVQTAPVEFAIVGRVVEWRGPAPYYYAEVPPPVSDDIAALAAAVTHGWGAVPVEARIGDTTFATSMFPKDCRYLLPLRDAVRRAEGVGPGDRIAVQLRLRPA